MPNTSNSNSEKTLKLTKDFVLISWLIFLLTVGILAVQGKASKSIIELRLNLHRTSKSVIPEQSGAPVRSSQMPPQSGSETSTTGQPLDPSQILQQYLLNTYSSDDAALIPPIAAVLDRLQVGLNWRKPKTIAENNLGRGEPTQADYEIYFGKVTDQLESIAIYPPDAEAKDKGIKISNNIVPPIFRGANFIVADVDLPSSAVQWIKQKQEDAAIKSKRLGLVDTFVLLIILGGFGSWIYLVRLHLLDPNTVDLENKTGLRGYVYRPLLGMGLALAVFIVDVSLHSLITTGSIEQIRRETLILLAFAAGLLSEKTYKYVEQIADDNLAKNTSGKQPSDDDTPPEDKDNPNNGSGTSPANSSQPSEQAAAPAGVGGNGAKLSPAPTQPSGESKPDSQIPPPVADLDPQPDIPSETSDPVIQPQPARKSGEKVGRLSDSEVNQLNAELQEFLKVLEPYFTQLPPAKEETRPIQKSLGVPQNPYEQLNEQTA